MAAQTVDIVDMAQVEIGIFASRLPSKISVTDADVRRLSVDGFNQTDQTSVRQAETDGIFFLVGKINHQRDFHIIQTQIVTANEGTVVGDGILLVRTFLIIKHFQTNIHEVSDRDKRTDTALESQFLVSETFVSVNLRSVAAYKNFSLNNLSVNSFRNRQQKCHQC